MILSHAALSSGGALRECWQRSLTVNGAVEPDQTHSASSVPHPNLSKKPGDGQMCIIHQTCFYGAI